MIRIFKNIPLVPVLIGLTTVAGCGSHDPAAEKFMIAHGREPGFNERWGQGSGLVHRGDMLIEDGARLIRRGKAARQKALDLTERGEETVGEQRRAYAQFVDLLAPGARFWTARDQLKRFENLVRKWQQGVTRLEEGRRLRVTSRALIQEGEAKIQAGEDLKRQGRDLLRQAGRPQGPETSSALRRRKNGRRGRYVDVR